MVIYFKNIMSFDFFQNFFLLLCQKIYSLEFIIALNFSLLRDDICFQSFFPSLFKTDLHSTNVSRRTGAFQPNKMLWLLNKFILFTDHKQALKYVWQSSYLNLWSNILYIIWQGVHLLQASCRLDELINKLLTIWSLSQAFLIYFTLYSYLRWSLSLW